VPQPEYVIAPSGWTPDDDNPFSADGSYGPADSAIVLRDGDDTRTWYGAGRTGLFALHLWAGLPDVRERVADFVRYENEHGRVSIVALPQDLAGRRFVDEALAQVPAAPRLRESDPRWVVHSTSEDAWRSIQRDRAISALSELPERVARVGGLGLRVLGEPPDFAEYVVLGRIDTPSAEIVVASQQNGRLCEDADAPYQPGVRLYLDGHAIITSGVAARDGRHTLKVRGRVSLPRFLAAVITSRNLARPNGLTEWTPRAFVTAANAAFARVIDGGAL